MSASKLTDDNLTKIRYYIEHGADTTVAATLAGVSRFTTNDWRTEGNKIMKEFDDDVEAIQAWVDTHEVMTKEDQKRTMMCVKYVEMVEDAKANCRAPLEMVMHDKAVSGDDPRFTLEYMSRKYPRSWGKDQTVRIEGGTTHVIKQIVIHGNEEKLQLEKQNPVDVEFEEVEDAAETVS